MVSATQIPPDLAPILISCLRDPLPHLGARCQRLASPPWCGHLSRRQNPHQAAGVVQSQHLPPELGSGPPSTHSLFLPRAWSGLHMPHLTYSPNSPLSRRDTGQLQLHLEMSRCMPVGSAWTQQLLVRLEAGSPSEEKQRVSGA